MDRKKGNYEPKIACVDPYDRYEMDYGQDVPIISDSRSYFRSKSLLLFIGFGPNRPGSASDLNI